MKARRVEPDGHLWLRVASPAWHDPFDGSFAAALGGRWNPAGGWPTIYLNRDLATARRQISRQLEGTPLDPEDLTDDAYVLVAARLPDAQTALDVIEDDALVSVGLPRTYPVGPGGRRVPREPCQTIARAAYESGLDGVECRSAATLDGGGRELAWWPRDRTLTPVAERVPYGHWRRPEPGAAAEALFGLR